MHPIYKLCMLYKIIIIDLKPPPSLYMQSKEFYESRSYIRGDRAVLKARGYTCIAIVIGTLLILTTTGTLVASYYV